MSIHSLPRTGGLGKARYAHAVNLLNLRETQLILPMHAEKFLTHSLLYNLGHACMTPQATSDGARAGVLNFLMELNENLILKSLSLVHNIWVHN